MTTRIDHRLAALKKENRPALVTFIMAGDPDLTTGQAILDALPQAGADIIELGMPFSDPMADGPVIQQGGRRALVAGQTLLGVLDMVTQFRAKDETTPIVLMGYYNPIYSFGVDKFLAAAVRAGVDGLIVVDLPAEEDAELCQPARAAGLNLIRLIPPTADDTRLPVVLENTSGFVYYVSMTGITGAAMTARASLDAAVARIKARTDLPVAVGFGIKTAADAAEIGRYADAIVVGSVLVEAVGKSLVEGTAGATTLPDLCAIVADLAAGVRRART